MTTLAHHFDEGGWGMYPIVVCCVILLGIALERAWTFLRPRDHGDDVVERLAWAIRTGDAQRALAISVQAEGPAARIARAALLSWSDSLAVLVIAMVRGGATSVEDELRATAQSIRNLIAENRRALRWDPPPPAGATYRDPG